jgi:hypothetical protein
VVFKNKKLIGVFEMSSKFSKYIFSDFKPYPQKANWQATYRPQDKTPLLRLDRDVFNGANFFAQCAWFWPAMVETDSIERSTKAHSHNYDEIVGMIGTDFNKPWELDGEAELTLGGEKHRVNNSCLIYLPAGFEHGPFREIKMNRPILQFECGMAPTHI